MGRERTARRALIPLLALATARATAEPSVRGSAGFALYQDGERTTVWSPYGRAGADLGRGVSLDAGYAADVITSASVDVITAGTPRMDDLRHEVSATGRLEAAGPWSGDAGYLYTFENDAQSHVAQGGIKRELWRKRVEVPLRLAVSWNAAGRRGQPRAEWRDYWVTSAETGLLVVLDRRTTVEALYSPYLVRGYQANPYRRVPVGGARADLRGALWLPENVPDERLRQAGTLRGARSLGSRWIVDGGYRFYADDWGVTGHTFESTQTVELGASLSLAAHERLSIQGAADFYSPRYAVETRYRTRDRRLSPMWAGLGGLALLWAPRGHGALSHVAARASADALAFRYDEFLAPDSARTGATLAPLGWVRGAIVQVGLEVRP